MKKPLQTACYDLAGNGIFRVLRLSLLARVLPVGNLGGGPGVRCLLVLILLHSFAGCFLYRLNASYSAQFARLKRTVRALLS